MHLQHLYLKSISWTPKKNIEAWLELQAQEWLVLGTPSCRDLTGTWLFNKFQICEWPWMIYGIPDLNAKFCQWFMESGIQIQLLGKDHIESTISLIKKSWFQPRDRTIESRIALLHLQLGAIMIHMLSHSPGCFPTQRGWVYIATVGIPLHAGERTRGPIYILLLVATVWRLAIRTNIDWYVLTTYL